MSLERRTLEDPEVIEVLKRRGEIEFGAVPPVAESETKLRPRWIVPTVVATLCVAVVAAASWPRATGPGPLPAALAPIIAGTVPIGSVTYGPDFAEGMAINPSFHPRGGLPTGFAITASVDRTMWGCGNRHVGGAQPPEGPAAAEIEARFLELVKHVRDDLGSQSNAIPVVRPYDPQMRSKFPAISMNLGLDWRNGSAGEMIEVPKGQSPAEEAELRKNIHRVAKRLTDATADGIQAMRANDPALP